MFGHWKLLGKAWPQFADQQQHRWSLKARHAGQVHSDNPVAFLPGVPLRLIALGFAMAGLGLSQSRSIGLATGVELLEHRGDLLVAIPHQTSVFLPELER